jgi:hypothetical protein
MGRFLGQAQYRYQPNLTEAQTDITSTTTLLPNTAYFANTTSSAFSVTLPTNPVPGTWIDIFDSASKWDTNNLTILPSGDGSTINGATDSLVMNVARVNLRLQYSSALNSWQIVHIM